MKNIICIIFFIVISSLLYSQDNIILTEKNDTSVCGRILIIDAIWVSDGSLNADISILDKQNSKPISGGYKKGSEITISSEPGCTYYIFSIEKNGSVNSKGTVVLSKTAPVSITEIIDGSFTAYENKSFKSGEYDWYFSSVSGDAGDLTANITITKNTVLIENLALKKGDLVFIGEFMYKVESIKPKSKDEIKDPQGYYEYNPGTIRFTSVKQYIPEK
jgi:hypothetical protein